jgi:hypothetical protein
MSESEPRKWIWTYRALPKPQHVVWGQGAPWEHDAKFIGWWVQDDDREWYEGIRIARATFRRYYPQVPYWDGYDFSAPAFGNPSSFPRWGSLKRAIADCETYLAKNEQDW